MTQWSLLLLDQGTVMQRVNKEKSDPWPLGTPKMIVLLKVPLYFLLGNLYINFRLLWEPTSKLIASYAQGMDVTDFWEVYRQRLHLATQQITCSKEEPASFPLSREYVDVWILTRPCLIKRYSCRTLWMYVRFEPAMAAVLTFKLNKLRGP
jgi:hypothetical protein